MPRQHNRISKIALEQFGYEQLRPGQTEVIQSILVGRDTLAIMPTGLGKSAIYQISAMILAGPTVVVSPLIALQRDQVESLQEQEVGGVAMVNSTLHPSERRQVFERLEQGELEFIFLAPEQLASSEVIERLRAAEPSLFVVDEAHCISDWGHSFRPDYLRLGGVIEVLGHPTVLALTATAAPPVRVEIIERLGMQEPQIIVKGFDRPNIWLGAELFPDENVKRRVFVERVSAVEKPGIIYVATRRRAEEIAALLCQAGVTAIAYHAGMRPRERMEAQNNFMRDEVEVIVATTAFGMGIDKPNVRFVFHYDMSDSVDSYYQEIGRAGRDGEQARALLFYQAGDVGIRRFFANGAGVDSERLKLVAETIHERGEPMLLQELRSLIALSQSQLLLALARLEEAGAVELLPDGMVRPCEGDVDLEAVSGAAAQSQERARRFEQSRVEMMRGYGELRGCRRQYLLNYFGETYAAPCDSCDNCQAGHGVEECGSQPFPVNSSVAHTAWGRGQVVRYEGDKIIVLFEEVGYKNLAVDLVVAHGLLASAA